MNEILIKMHILLLQIFSNGAYKSVLHRVRVNSTRPRMSVASFHSLPAERVVGPAPELVDEAAGKPRRYMDTDFATFLAYLASADGKDKTFLQSRMLLSDSDHDRCAAASILRPSN